MPRAISLSFSLQLVKFIPNFTPSYAITYTYHRYKYAITYTYHRYKYAITYTYHRYKYAITYTYHRYKYAYPYRNWYTQLACHKHMALIAAHVQITHKCSIRAKFVYAFASVMYKCCMHAINIYYTNTCESMQHICRLLAIMPVIASMHATCMLHAWSLHMFESLLAAHMLMAYFA